jgi:hypothetical protein
MNSCTVKVFFAGRQVRRIEHYMTKFRSSVIKMEDVNKSDIHKFVDSFLPEVGFPDILRKATEYILEHAQ